MKQVCGPSSFSSDPFCRMQLRWMCDLGAKSSKVFLLPPHLYWALGQPAGIARWIHGKVYHRDIFLHLLLKSQRFRKEGGLWCSVWVALRVIGVGVWKCGSSPRHTR
jgi:hypothetical protein